MTVVPATPSPLPTLVSRRQLLIGGASLLISGCGVFGDTRTDQPAPEASTPDPLLTVTAAARADASMATQLAATSPPQAVALRSVAAERAAHAQALEAEITRATGTGAPSSTPLPGPSAATLAPSPPSTIEMLRAGLQRNQRATAELACTSAPYRAGLLGSIAAACATQLAVLL